MQRRLLMMGAILCVSAALAACGGGGGITPVRSSPTPSATSTPTPAPPSSTFSGTATTATTFAYPSPSPYPATNVAFSITQTVTNGAALNPYGPAGATNFHTVETDTAAAATHVVTTDAWLAISGSDVLEYGYNAADDTGDSMTAAFTTPAILDQIPESDGATWTNPAGITEVEKDADGTASTRTYAADGTYAETTTADAGLVKSTTTENADGSGSLVTNGSYLGHQVDSLTFSAPASNQVAVTVNFVQLPAPQPATTPRTYTAPAWYGTATPVLFSQNSAITSGVPYPSTCSVPSVYGTTGNKVVQTTNRLDTILGYTDSQTQTTYTNAQFGPVCVVLSDVLANYYDYQDDFATADAVHLHFPGTPLSTSTTSQTLTLQPGAAIRTQSKSEQSAAPPLTLARIASASAAFQLRVEHVRRQKLPAFKENR